MNNLPEQDEVRKYLHVRADRHTSTKIGCQMNTENGRKCYFEKRCVLKANGIVVINNVD